MPKKVKIGIIISLLIAAAVIGFSFYQKYSEDRGLIKDIARNLSEQDKKAFEDRIAENLKKLEETEDSSIKFDLYSRLGFDEYALGHLKKSKGYFEEAIKISSSEYGVYQGLFQTLVEMRDYAEAEVAIKKSINIRPNSAHIWKQYIQFKADVMHSSKDEMTALYAEALEKTRVEAGDYTDIITSYASWLEKIGNYQAAKEYWQKAIEMNPTSKSLYEAEIKRLDALLQQQQ